MIPYKNLGGDSGVSAYDIEADQIVVQFTSGKIYKYSYASAGYSNIEEMKRLAYAGCGLNSFIQRHVRLLYVK
ncbi:hypothetical protein [Chromobacterium violaceum]|uniref:hypothetical protein n=1 Tax=Chromobacterium violaceum TaxID=536 RepID=UPI0015FA0C95|nr:hypothetical protein [Chromobacterium violaceum]MBA8736078.1 hypothetical protein [Chromobacterium violaceum]